MKKIKVNYSNKRTWSESELKTLYEMGKAKTPLKDVYTAFPNRTEDQVKNKAYRMGFTWGRGVLEAGK